MADYQAILKKRSEERAALRKLKSQAAKDAANKLNKEKTRKKMKLRKYYCHCGEAFGDGHTGFSHADNIIPPHST